MDRKKRERTELIARIVLLAAFLALIVFASVKLTPTITRLIGRRDDFKAFIDSYGSVAALAYIMIQALQVVVFVIPGEIVQVAGGYIFGTGLGTLYSVAGILLGTMIDFFAARLLGYSLVRALVSPKKLEKFDFLINNPKSEIAMFILFLVPGIPKDSLVYISGLTPVQPLRFFLISMIARFPGLWGSAYIGANLQEKDYLPVWILSGIALALFIIGVLNRDKIINALHRLRRQDRDTPPDIRP